jgi:hypothetical protein
MTVPLKSISMTSLKPLSRHAEKLNKITFKTPVTNRLYPNRSRNIARIGKHLFTTLCKSCE